MGGRLPGRQAGRQRLSVYDSILFLDCVDTKIGPTEVPAGRANQIRFSTQLGCGVIRFSFFFFSPFGRLANENKRVILEENFARNRTHWLIIFRKRECFAQRLRSKLGNEGTTRDCFRLDRELFAAPRSALWTAPAQGRPIVWSGMCYLSIFETDVDVCGLSELFRE